WLVGIARHVCADWRKARVRDEQATEAETLDRTPMPAGPTLEDLEERERVRQDVLSLSDRDYQRYTQTTRLGNPKTREWVAELQKTYEDPDALLQAVLRMFQRDNFFYSLNPPLLSEDFVDDFLFNSRKGFCAHYAGSFAYLARLAGVPARVVAGYQGGEWNESGEYITVHQFDAHAWVELWREGAGWQRVDPTAYVSPSRIESGLQEAVREEGSFLQDNLFSPARYNDFQLVRWVRWQLDSLNYQWQKWIVGYNADVQEGLLPAWMKKDIVFALVATMTGLITLFALAFTGWSWYQRNRHHYPVMVRLYLRFIRSCQSVGIDYSGYEGPLDFSRKVKATLPEQTELVDRITQDYIRYTFSPEAGQILSRQQEVKAFKDKVSRFSQSVYGKRLKKFGVKRL
ncbi:MAG: transglutaminase family protein, partial [Pseudomonadales bacterium]|nr:transglutaminase family protein [Pseudomonadales bacterium]